ncbi:tetratricopeptide repeat protein [uncultured Bacteroides sp.]|uniref:tetratricopeptide repeat protein n=1 Tax=uncultured Bacteroides sp. TaxID=162156 RepID=UPI00262355F2|nr:tetratricopeptide repeat protein [uncultured Bacteroides sp.]
MKHLLLYLLLACTLILPGACTHPTTPPVLLCADSLASANPDSAQALLASLAEEMKQEPQDVQMYYRLLCIKAKDKAYITHTSDSAILPVVEYYEREGDKKHLPEAYYYAGRVYRDLGDAPQALDYFEKALDAMQENENLKVKTKVYAQMGTLFSYQNLYEEALNMFKHSLQCDISLKDSIGMVFNYRDMADAYRSLKKPDSALYYYQKSYQLCQQLERKDLGNMLQSQLASFYLDRGEYPQAQKALQHALQDIKSYNKSGIYSIAAHYYHDIDNIDSAQWYYNELLQCGSIYSKELAYRGLTNIMLRKGKSISAAEFLYQALLLGDSIHKITVTEDIRRSHALYKHQVREKENQRLKLQNLKQRQTGIFLIIAFALLSGSGILYYLRRKKAMQRRLKVAEQLREEAYRRSREFMEENNRQIQALESDIERLKHQLHDSDQQKMELEQKISIIESTNRQVELEQGKRRMEEGLFFRSDIHGLFRQKVEAGKAPGQTEWEQLARQLDASFDHFTQKLLQLGLLKEKELHTCMLIKAQFKNKEMAQLLCLSPEGISSIRRRLCARFLDGKREPKEWDRFILSL